MRVPSLALTCPKVFENELLVFSTIDVESSADDCHFKVMWILRFSEKKLKHHKKNISIDFWSQNLFSVLWTCSSQPPKWINFSGFILRFFIIGVDAEKVWVAILIECEACLECCLRISTEQQKAFILCVLYRMGEFQYKCSLPKRTLRSASLNSECVLEFILVWFYFFSSASKTVTKRFYWSVIGLKQPASCAQQVT